MNAALLSLAVVLGFVCLIFATECLLAVLPFRGPRRAERETRPRTAVLVPAHDEAAILEQSLRDLLGRLAPGESVLLVADNCSDETAEIGRSLGVETIERDDPEHVGKAFALDFGVRHLAAEPPEIVVVIDADCRVAADSVATLASVAHARNRPVQGAYLIEAPPGSTPLQAVSSLGVTFKNLIRPLGLSRVGAPSPLFGSGMAVPWELLRAAPVARESLVEDAELGIELALAGHPAVFCPESRVTSPLPRRDRDGIVQRKRWEHGSLGIIVSQVPRLLRGALRQRRVDLLWMALDACVPPLSLLVLCWLGVTAVAVASGWRSGAWLPLGILLASATVLAAGFFLGWLVFCRSTVSVSTLARIPAYILKKLPIYGTWLLGRRSRWARTKRDEDG